MLCYISWIFVDCQIWLKFFPGVKTRLVLKLKPNLHWPTNIINLTLSLDLTITLLTPIPTVPNPTNPNRNLVFTLGKRHFVNDVYIVSTLR